MMTVKEMHAGDGYAYLMRGVADSAGMAGGAMSQVTTYYAAEGNPPGVWLGTGLAGLNDGHGIDAGATVTGDQMEALFKHGLDPITGEILGRRNRVATPLRERVAARVAELDATLTGDARAEAVATIERQEAATTPARAVAGFDFTFTTPKSVSALWAVTDAGVREQLYEAHRAAVADVVATFEQMARTRIGVNGAAQVETRGVVAAAFDHWDNRNGDPHLHTHVVIANRVQAEDGRWRTLDSLGSVFPNVVALSELYNNVLASQITGRLGIEWEQKTGRSKAATWELAGVDRRLSDAFSTRRAEILAARTELEHDHIPTTEHGSRALDQRAWRATRQAKQIVSLRDHLADWRARAAEVLGSDPSRWAARLTGRAARRRDHRRVPLMRADDLAAGDEFDELAHHALTELAESRSTWTTANIRAAVSRATMQVRFASTTDITTAIDQLTHRVEQLCVDLTPPETLHTPAHYRRTDGTSAFRRARIFTAQMLLDAETRLTTAGRRMDGPRLDLDVVSRYVAAPDTEGRLLADDQAASVAQIAVSGRSVDVLVGPAGTGKTTTLAKLTAAWQSVYGADSVIGLAPSAAAAQVLAESLNIATDNTAKWLHEQQNQPKRIEKLSKLNPRSQYAAKLEADIARWSMRPGSLVLVDEASLAGTLALDRLRAQAEASGAKLLLVGDPYQLSAVEAGGAFGLLVNDREGTAPELTGVWRFHAEWERDASIRLRLGDPDVLDQYASHDRIHDTVDATDAAYNAWRADEAQGLTSLLIAADNTTVAALNARARADRVVDGLVSERGVALHDGTLVGTGDRIVTRKNDRTLSTGRGWVKNGDTWDVIKAHRDGSLLIRRRTGGAAITLPAAYVADHVELTYATTAHRAQGATVDTGHVVVDQNATMTREVLYVAMTRGRVGNHVHVNTSTTCDPDHQHLDEAPRTAHAILTDVLRNAASSISATERHHHELVADTALGKIVAEYETIRRWATRDRYADLLHTALPDTPPTQLPEWRSLIAALRRLEAAGVEPTNAVTDAAATLPESFTSAELDAALRAAAQNAPAPTRRTIAGLIPADTTTGDPDLRRALDERETIIVQHAHRLATHAITTRAPWLRHLGPRPTDPTALRAWVDRVTTIAVYRELNNITTDEPVGPAPTTWEQHARWQYANHAAETPVDLPI